MRQRVAIARTLAAGSDVLLMDEPFGALDALARERLQVEFAPIQQREAKTIIFVTHDVEEAVFLADRIIVFSQPARRASWPTSTSPPPRPRAAAGAPRRREFFRCATESCISSATHAGSEPYEPVFRREDRRDHRRQPRYRAWHCQALSPQRAPSLHMLADDAAVQTAAGELGATAPSADITDRQAVSAALGRIARIDVLINNAGLELMTPIDDDSADEVEAAFRRIIEINVIGTFAGDRAALPRMRAGGTIINTASIWGRVAEPLFGAYVASKHAVIGLTKTWAKELGPRGIRVNAVCPGWVRTDASMRSLGRMAERAAVGEHGASGRDRRRARRLPGLMEPADVAGTYLFLASRPRRQHHRPVARRRRGEVPW